MQELKIRGSEETTIDLLRLAKALLKKIWLLVAVTIIFGIGGYVYSAFLITPTYRTSFTAYVNNRNTAESDKSTSTADLNASMSLANLYSEIITSRSVLMDAVEECDLPAEYTQLRGMVTASVSNSAALITVYVQGQDPEEVTAFASGISKAAPVHVARVVDGSSMRIVDAPVKPTTKHTPNNARNTMTAATIGLALSACMVILAELVNDRVQNSEELENRYQLPLIGSIPDIARAKGHGKYGYRYGYYKYGYKYSYKYAYKYAQSKGGKGSK